MKKTETSTTQHMEKIKAASSIRLSPPSSLLRALPLFGASSDEGPPGTLLLGSTRS